MIGQLNLQNRLLNIDINTLTKALILEGDYGCGKHLLLNKLSDKYHIDIVDISTNISDDLLMNIYLTTQSKFYLIDINKAAVNKKIILLQNTILKFLEEPPKQAYIFIFCKNKSQLLSTIQNRCQILSFEKYTIAQLKQFSVENSIELLDDSLYEIYNTPGKLLTLQNNFENVNSLKKLIQNIIDNVHRANTSNVLTIVNKLDFENNEYNLDIFLHMMKRTLVKEMQTSDNFSLLKQYYILTQQLSEQLLALNINKQYLFENYLLNLKSVSI